jgi:hypothetical protein
MLRKYFGGGAALWLALSAGAWAQDAPPVDAQPSGDAADSAPADGAEANEAVSQFDSDSDGQLLGDELRRARDFMQALRGAMGNRDRAAGPPRDGDGRRPLRDRDERGRRGGLPAPEDAPPFEIGDGPRPPRPEGPGEAGGDGAPPRQRPDQSMRLFREFDDNEDGQLNRDEFTALMGALRERRGLGTENGPRGDAIGPPDRPEDRRGFGEGGGPPRGRRGEGFGPPRREGREGARRPPRDGDGGQAFQPDASRDVA